MRLFSSRIHRFSSCHPLRTLHPVRPDPSLFLNPDDGSTHSDVSLELPWRRLALPVAGLSPFLGGYSPIQRCRPGLYPSPLAPQNKKRAWKFSLSFPSTCTFPMRPSSPASAAPLPIAFSGLLQFFAVPPRRVFVLVATLVLYHWSRSAQPASQ